MANLAALQTHVCQLAEEPRFIHHKWFVTHHLDIIAQIVEELLVLYPQANATVARSMVWVHDWGKILSNKGPDEDERTIHAVKSQLPQWGFTQPEIDHILTVYEEMERLQPHAEDFLLETKIISSADALAHYIGPFFALYWYENPEQSVNDLIAGNIKKAARDERKLMLPEAVAAAAPRLRLLRENHPDYRPRSYLS